MGRRREDNHTESEHTRIVAKPASNRRNPDFRLGDLAQRSVVQMDVAASCEARRCQRASRHATLADTERARQAPLRVGRADAYRVIDPWNRHWFPEMHTILVDLLTIYSPQVFYNHRK